MPENSFDLPPLPERLDSERPSVPSASRRTVLTLGAVAGAAMFLLPRRSAHAVGVPDQTDLRFLTELQQLQADFFTSAALAHGAEGFTEREANAINLIAKQDSDQARWFSTARSIFPAGAFEQPSKLNLSSSKPITNYQIPATKFASRKDFFDEAIRIKQTAVGVFHEAVGSASDPDWIQAIASLAGVQNRHLALLLDASGGEPFTPFVPTVTFSEATARLASYKFDPKAL